MNIEKKLLVLDYFTKLIRKKLNYKNNYFLTDIYNFSLLKDKQIFTIQQIKSFWEDFLNNSNNHVVHFYLWIPYCKQRCLYCVYYTELANNDRLEKYTDSVVNLLKHYKSLFKIRRFDSLYFWWWTPSMLSVEQMEMIFSYLFDYVKFNEPCEKTIEANPDSITFEKMEVIKKYWFNRISFGIESFNKEALLAINRWYQTQENVINKIKYALKLWFDVVTGDIIYWLPLDTPDSFVKSIKILIKNWLKHIKLYALQPNTFILTKYFNNDYNKFLWHVKEFIDAINVDLNPWLKSNWYPAIDKIDYIPSNAEPIHLSLEKVNIWTRYQFNSIVAKWVFWLWHHANSYIYGKIHYHSLPLKVNARDNLFKGDVFTPRDEKIYYIYIVLWVNGSINLNQYRKIFWTFFEEDFKEVLEDIFKLNLWYIENDYFVLNEKIRDNSRWKFIVWLLFQDMDLILNRINQLKCQK